PVAQPYISQFASLTLNSGRVSAKGDVTYAGTPEAAPPLKFTGDVQVADLRTTDELKEDFVKWRELAVTGISFQQNPDKLTIERIAARQPYAKVVIAPDSTLNVSRVLTPAGSAPPPAAKSDEESADAQTADKEKSKDQKKDKDK